MNYSKFWILLLVVLVGIQSTPALGSRTSKEAYATLLYGDEFLLGVRVLGKSIRDTGSNKDMVVLVSDGVSDYAKRLLKADGWIVEKISLLANPNQVRPKRFWGVYTKLKIFNMTDYKKGILGATAMHLLPGPNLYTTLPSMWLSASDCLRNFTNCDCCVLFFDFVYLDADTIVVKSIEDLFKCGKFCANLKHSERLNSGVLVVEPSQSLFDDMMSKVGTLPSYTGGDQGFLNSYYSDFPNAHVFVPSIPQDVVDSKPLPETQRLSTLYNADVGLYMLANKWMVDESELHVIHYTLGPLKPWDWWTSWLLKPVDVWQNVREQLEEKLPGTAGGKNPSDEFMVKFLFLLPVCALIFCYYRALLQPGECVRSLCRGSLVNQIRHLYYKIRSSGTVAYSGVSSPSNISSSYQTKVPSYLAGTSIFACFLAAFLSLGIALAIIPPQVMPWTGLVLMYEWTFTVFFFVFGGYLRLVYHFGRRTAIQAGSFSSDVESVDYDSGKGHQRQVSSCDMETWYYGLGMAFLAILAPSLPCLFGINALFARMGLMGLGGIVLASFMTYASEHLAIRSFLRGGEDRDSSRNLFFSC